MRLAILILAALTACGPTVGGTGFGSDAEQPKLDTCGRTDVEILIGETISAFDQTGTDAPLRVIPPRSIVTTDFQPKRLNIDLNDNEKIVRVWCG